MSAQSLSHRSKAYIGFGIGFLIGGMARLVFQVSDEKFVLAVIVLALSFGAWTYGAVNYAYSKGYSRWWGLMGLLAVVGVLILMCFPDRRRQRR